MRSVAWVMAVGLAGCAARGPEEPRRPQLTLDDVFKLQQSGVDSKVIVAKIQTSDVQLDLPVARIIELKVKGLPDDVLEALVRATEVEDEPRRGGVRRYMPSYWDPWHHPYAY